jgi:N-acetylmuramoyl-L-alanine amidase
VSRRRRWIGATVATAGLVASLAATPPLVEGSARDRVGETAAYVSAPTSASFPLAGVRIALDPGHQLGNHNFPRQIRRLVPAGGFEKPCNTTGTSTNGGFPEATVDFRIARLAKARLEALGAHVYLTRTRNSQSLWGPCVNERGRFGKEVRARLMVSLHADGAGASAHGFHVIAPRARSPWTTDIARPSRRLARALRAGFDAHGIPRSNYVGDGRALSIRADLGTLNLSDVPVAMLEIGNMRNSGDAHRMTTRKGRLTYSRAVVRGIRLYLAR